MNDLDNWSEISPCLYRFVVGINVAYEITVYCHYHDTDILTAKASLFIVSSWSPVTERICVLKQQPVINCIEAAIKHKKENEEKEN